MLLRPRATGQQPGLQVLQRSKRGESAKVLLSKDRDSPRNPAHFPQSDSHPVHLSAVQSVQCKNCPTPPTAAQHKHQNTPRAALGWQPLPHLTSRYVRPQKAPPAARRRVPLPNIALHLQNITSSHVVSLAPIQLNLHPSSSSSLFFSSPILSQHQSCTARRVAILSSSAPSSYLAVCHVVASPTATQHRIHAQPATDAPRRSLLILQALPPNPKSRGTRVHCNAMYCRPACSRWFAHACYTSRRCVCASTRRAQHTPGTWS